MAGLNCLFKVRDVNYRNEADLVIYFRLKGKTLCLGIDIL